MHQGKWLILSACLLVMFVFGGAAQAQRSDSTQTVQSIFQNLAALNGQEVSVLGFYTSPQDSKLMANYGDYLNRRPIAAEKVIFINGILPPSPYWHGGLVIATGTVSFVPKATPFWGIDTASVTITVTSYELLVPGFFTPPPPTMQEGKEDDSNDKTGELACDPCKFAILISGGIDAENNNPGFWKDIENLYEYKTDPAGGNYCPENVEILYYDGNSGNSGAIHDSLVNSCTEANVQAAHDRIAKKIAQCQRDSMDATVQKMISNHGEDGAGACLFGPGNISPEELKNMQQPLIDSCCDFMFDEFTECFGGDMAEGIKGLDDKAKTEIHGNSAAGGESSAWGDETGSVYLQEKIRRLRLGEDYESAVRGAKEKYKEDLEKFKAEIDSLIDEIDSILNVLPPGDPDRDELEKARDELQGTSNDLQDSLADGSDSWVRYIFKKYCEWKKIVVAPGGQFKLKFKGSGGCGNVSVYKENADGSKTKVKVWNWNLPGSAGYVAGNDERVINADLTGTGIYWIHNDNGEFQVTVDALKSQTLPESASNIPTFAGFSLGGTDNSPAEFGLITSPGMTIPNIELTPLNLVSVPSTIGPCGGVGQLTVTFTAQPNPWWQDMELHIVPFQVMQPGMLQIQCPSAQIPFTQIPLSPGPPTPFTVHLGMIPPGMAQLSLISQGGLCVMMDSWGMRSLIPTFPEYVCGDADGNGIITISDAVFLINYIFSGGPAPSPVAAGDADCNTIVTISDAVYLINYICSGGPSPCSGC